MYDKAVQSRAASPRGKPKQTGKQDYIKAKIVSRGTFQKMGASTKAKAEKRAAILEASHAAAEKMLTRYRDGLRDGASLTAGRGHINLASCTPDGGANAAASPWGSSQSL